ncbi:hypothetical protein JNUCC1_00517 [Lentibacillus sp. JNUCC-1]|nr:hypothetical protein [Lentibacillus sp. JNUCC-1]
MTYRGNVIKLLFRMDDHLFRVKQAEKMSNIWKTTAWLFVAAMGVYIWMAWLGMGTNLLSEKALMYTPEEYEAAKFWFVIGRAGFGLLLAALILFVPSLLFYYLTGIPYKKLVYMQQAVLLLLLVERLIWIPLAVYAGLDWYVSPMSFGPLMAYITSQSWLIYFFGAISLFQILIIWFQAKFLKRFGVLKLRWIWTSLILLHIFEWAWAALLASVDHIVLGGWFG